MTTFALLALVPGALSAPVPSPIPCQGFGTEAQAISPLPNLVALTTGDLDGDGDLDVVGAGLGSTPLIRCENLGDGRLGAQKAIPILSTGMFPRAVVIADLDGDGDQDVLYGGSQPHLAGWIENLGAGNFGPEHILANGGGNGVWVDARDMDGDGRLDVLLQPDLHRVDWYRNLGGGTFASAQLVGSIPGLLTDETIVDLDLDGDLDLLLADRNSTSLQWAEQTSPGVFAPTVPLVSGLIHPDRVDTLDVDQDGDLDVVYVNWLDSALTLLRQLTPGSYGAPEVLLDLTYISAEFRDLQVVDLDGDGADDCLFSSTDQAQPTLGWLRNTGGAFASPAAIGDGMNIGQEVEAADLDGDGDLDVLTVDYRGIQWYQQDPNGFASGTTVTLNVLSNSILVPGDFDGDRRDDLVFASTLHPHRFQFIKNEGEGQWVAQSPAVQLPAPHQLIPVDFDGDGDLDVVASGGSYDQISSIVRWSENLGAGVMAAPATILAELGDSEATISLGDMEGDGDLDVFYSYIPFNLPRRYQWSVQVTPGVMMPGPLLPASTSTLEFKLADIDGDGDADIVAKPIGSLAELVWRENNGSGMFGSPLTVRPVSAGALEGFDVGDIDGDGREDVLASGSEGVQWYRSLPAGGFSAPTVIEPGIDAGTMAILRDVNRSERLDVLVSSSTLQARWYANQSAGIFGPIRRLDAPEPGSRVLGTGDRDGDGDIDILIRPEAGGAAWNENLRRRGDAYCGPAATNSTGLWAAVSATGSTSVSTNDLVLLAEFLPPFSFGYFLVATEAGLVPVVPFSQGSLCIGGTIGRLNRGSAEIFSSDSSGTAAVPFDAASVPTPTGAMALLPGDTRFFQAWYRDSNPMITSNFTNGLRIEFE